MNRRPIRPYAALAALSLAAASLLTAGAAAAEDAVPTTTSAEDAPSEPLPAPKTNTYAVGQSVQIRLDADGNFNSALTDFRWAVTQVTVQGPESGVQEIPVPEGSTMLHSLQEFSRIPQADGVATYTVDVQNGYGTARSVGLMPSDYVLPVDLEVKFTLDGAPITAADLLGKTGVVTAQYTVKNLSRQTVDVPITATGTGEEVIKPIEADVPMVVIAKTLLPTRFTGLNTGKGQFGADGRGNNQVQWIALPFSPLSEDGTSTFGWAANVNDAVIPSMLIQVAPLYIPPQPEGEEAPAEAGRPPLGPVPGLDPVVAEIQAGLADVALGLQGFAESDSPDPLDALEQRLNTFFTEFGTDLQTVAAAVDPNNPDSATNLLAQAVPALQQVTGPISGLNENWDQISSVVDIVAGFDKVPGGARILCETINSAVDPDLPLETCQQAIDTAVALQPQLDTIGGQLSVLAPTLSALTPVLEGLLAALTDLSAKLTTIADGLAAQDVALPTVDAVVASIISDIVSSPNGQLVTGGLDQVSAGVGQAKALVSDYVAQVITQVQAVGVDTAATIDTVKAEAGGIVVAAQASPLPYGGDPAAAPVGTVLAGAYEFRVDAADTNEPLTLPRILVGVLLLVAAGVGALLIDRRRRDSAAAAGEPAPSQA